MASFGEKIYNDTASLGQTFSLISLVIGCIVAVILFIIGGFAVFKNTDNEWTSGTGTIESATCTPVTTTTTASGKTTTSTSYNCTLKISHTVSDVTYSNISLTQTSTSILEKGSSVSFQYKISDPNTARQTQIPTATVGYILFGIGVFIILVASLQYYLTRRSKIYAGATGVSGITNMLFR
jgi:hypothetical protein